MRLSTRSKTPGLISSGVIRACLGYAGSHSADMTRLVPSVEGGMRGRISKILTSFGEFLRCFGSGEAGIMPAMRDKDGTFGTQRMNIKARAEERERRFPTR